MAKVAMQHQINANLLHKWITSVQINAPALKTPSIPQTDFLPVILHATQSNKKHSTTCAREESCRLYQDSITWQAPSSGKDQMIEIDWPVESVTELLLLLIQGLDSMIRIDEIWLSTSRWTCVQGWIQPWLRC
ncbi:IS66 family insertion sequence element accessory protein TnpB [Acinetobacter baumannii]